jgi:TRAP-type C4-dicarboxylate transport system permease small subunit
VAVLTALNALLARLAMYITVACLLGIVGVVVGSVFWRYVLSDAPPWSEQVALLLVINVALFGAAAVVRDEGHIGMESLASLLPPRPRAIVSQLVGVITALFGVILCWGCMTMAQSVWQNGIPTLGISEACRYLPGVAAGVLFVLFSIEHMLAAYLNRVVVPSWH